MTVERDLEAAEERVRSKKGKVREAAIRQARTRVLQQYGIRSMQERKTFADPALMM